MVQFSSSLKVQETSVDRVEALCDDSCSDSGLVDLEKHKCTAGSIQELRLHGVGMLDFSKGMQPMLLDPHIFSSLKVLWMKSDMNIRINIPGDVRLTSLEIYVDTLGLYFEDADATCLDLAIVNILHRSRGPVRGQIGTLQLQEAFDRKGTSLNRKYVDEGSISSQGDAAPEASNLGLSYVGISESSDLEYHLGVFRGAQAGCRCKMCWACRKLGSIPRR